MTHFYLSKEDVNRLENGLQVLARVQEQVSGMVGAIPIEGKLATPDQVRTYFLALIRECSELLEEFNWKPWKKERAVDHGRASAEFADILAFLGIIIVYMRREGVLPGDLADAYAKKSSLNVSRFNGEVDGYGR